MTTQLAITSDKRYLCDALLLLLKQLPIEIIKHKTHYWAMVIGENGAGKTSFLNQTGLTLYQNVTKSNEQINIWHNKQASIVELPSLQCEQSELKRFVKTLQRYQGGQGFNSIILCLDMRQSIQQPPREFVLKLRTLKKSLITLATTNRQQPQFFINFTKLDCIAGFCDTFAQSEDDAWGYSFTPYPNKASLLQQNNTLFDNQLGALHQQMIEKLHHSDAMITRYLVREFPLQMESIRNMVRACINQLYSEVFQFSGIYFTSATQSNQALDRLSSHVATTFELTVCEQVPQSTQHRARFVRGFLAILLIQRQQLLPAYKSHLIVPSLIFSAIITVACSYHFYTNKQNLENAAKQMHLYQQLSQGSNDPLPAIEHLLLAENAINHSYSLLPLKSFTHYKAQIHQRYQSSLHDKYLPSLASTIEQVLNSQLTVQQRYDALKAYLMLGSSARLNNDYLRHWLIMHWRQSLSENKLKQQVKHLTAALKQPYLGTALNSQLVESERHYLNALPKDYLYFELIKGHLPDESQFFTAQGFTLLSHQIPTIYTRHGMAIVFKQHIPNFAKHIQKDSFVLGDTDVAAIEKELTKAYLTHYKNYWQKFAQQVSPKTFNDYKAGSLLTSALSNERSPLEQIYHLIHNNTAHFNNPSDQQQQAFNQIVATPFMPFNLNGVQQLTVLRPKFLELTSYLSSLANINSSGETAFRIARLRFTQAEIDPLTQLYTRLAQLPSPINNWVESITGNSWQLILQDTKRYINTSWQQQVYRFNQQMIRKHFPFNSQSDSDLSLQSFSDFFNSEGRLAQFVDYYLAPFIDRTNIQWTSKTLNGLRLPLSEQGMNELIKAKLIRKIFFNNHRQSPRIQFSLHAITLQPSIKRFTISIGDKSLIEQPDNKTSREFTWPNLKNESSRIIIEKDNGESVELSEVGPWSWFRLLSQSAFRPMPSHPENYQLILNIDGLAAKFILANQSALNPFVPGLLSSFKLPENIT